MLSVLLSLLLLFSAARPASLHAGGRDLRCERITAWTQRLNQSVVHNARDRLYKGRVRRTARGATTRKSDSLENAIMKTLTLLRFARALLIAIGPWFHTSLADVRLTESDDVIGRAPD